MRTRHAGAFTIFLALLGAALGSASAEPALHPRPSIEGVSHLAVYSRDLAASDHFYRTILGGRKGTDPEDPAASRYYFGTRQFVEVLPAPPGQATSMLAHVAYETADVPALRRHLVAHGTGATGELHSGADASRWFSVRDPEGNLVQFVQSGRAQPSRPSAVSDRIIHVGYLVHDRAAEDSFYRSLLGFRPYWFGAMHDGAVDWISQQVPDGRDWLEYMMVGPGSTNPTGMVDARLLGVLNHVSLAVPNMEAAVTRLYAEGRLPPRHDGPSMGLDGKWQANLYDPDGTRIELMEYHAVSKPCCSAFTASDPAPPSSRTSRRTMMSTAK
jgi:catechol 2,3-dioxygenase-like lactoylglutathione lyase family enzyme